jgi:glycosyltransferase involved in cell wall biosynthesis
VTDLQERRIRVLHLGSPTGLYGAERWILALAKHLPTERVESWVGVIKDSPDLEAPLCVHATQLGLRTQLFESHGKLSLSAIFQLRRFIDHNNVDILHSHGYKTDIIGRLATLGSGCVTVATPHGWSTNGGLRLNIYEALNRLAYQFIDVVVPLSTDLYEGLACHPRLRSRLHLIPNAVDLSEFDAFGVRAESQGLQKNDAFVIGYVGRLISSKRIDTLIRAFHELQVRGKRLEIVGEGPQRTELEQLAAALGESRSVSFLGYREDRVALLRGFDIFVLPSEHEGIPRCLMESMAAGTAVIASNIPGCRDLVEDGITGLLFTAGDEADLSRKIEALFANPDRRAHFALAGRQRVRERYSAKTMATRYLALYDSLLRHRARVASTADAA